jgi:hypothetical protein
MMELLFWRFFRNELLFRKKWLDPSGYFIKRLCSVADMEFFVDVVHMAADSFYRNFIIGGNFFVQKTFLQLP